MLAEGGRLAIDARTAVVKAESRPDQPQGTVARVHALEDVAVLELRVVHDLVHFPDGAAGHVRRGQPGFPGAWVVGGHGRLDDLAQGWLTLRDGQSLRRASWRTSGRPRVRMRLTNCFSVSTASTI